MIDKDDENKTILIEEFNKIPQEIIDKSNKEVKIIWNFEVKLKTSKKGKLIYYLCTLSFVRIK